MTNKITLTTIALIALLGVNGCAQSDAMAKEMAIQAITGESSTAAAQRKAAAQEKARKEKEAAQAAANKVPSTKAAIAGAVLGSLLN